MSFKAVFNTYTDRDLVETCEILTKRDARLLEDVEHVTHHVELSPNCQTSPSPARPNNRQLQPRQQLAHAL